MNVLEVIKEVDGLFIIKLHKLVEGLVEKHVMIKLYLFGIQDIIHAVDSAGW